MAPSAASVTCIDRGHHSSSFESTHAALFFVFWGDPRCNRVILDFSAEIENLLDADQYIFPND